MKRRLALLVLLVPAALLAQSKPPVLDMHLHALGANDQGPAPLAMCTPFPSFPAWDPRTPYPQVFVGLLSGPTDRVLAWREADVDGFYCRAVPEPGLKFDVGVVDGADRAS